MAERSAPAWHRIVKAVHLTIFFTVWFGAIAAGYVYVSTHSRGLPAPTATHTQPFTTHGNTVYITPQQERRVQLWMYFVLPGIPFILGLTGVLYLVGVRLDEDEPTLDEVLQRLPPSVQRLMADIRRK